MGDFLKREFSLDPVPVRRQEMVDVDLLLPTDPFGGSVPLGTPGGTVRATLPREVTTQRPSFLRAFLGNLPFALGAGLSAGVQGKSPQESFGLAFGGAIQGVEAKRQFDVQAGISQQRATATQQFAEAQQTTAQANLLRAQQPPNLAFRKAGSTIFAIDPRTGQAVNQITVDAPPEVSEKVRVVGQQVFVERSVNGRVSLVPLTDAQGQPFLLPAQAQKIRVNPEKGTFLAFDQQGQILNRGRAPELKQPRVLPGIRLGEAAKKTIAILNTSEQTLLEIETRFGQGNLSEAVGPINSFLGRGGEITGLISDEEATFRNLIAQQLNEEVNRLSGAAVSPEEFIRLRAGLPNLGMTAPVFRAAVQNSINRIQRLRQNLILQAVAGDPRSLIPESVPDRFFTDREQ